MPTKVSITASDAVKATTSILGSCAMATAIPSAFRDVDYFVTTLNTAGGGGAAYVMLVAKDNSQIATVQFPSASGLVSVIRIIYIFRKYKASQ